MGLGTINLTRILQAFKENGIGEKSLCMIGKQDIHISWDILMEIVHNYDFYYDKEVYERIKNIQPIDSYKLFEMFGISGGIDAVDFSEYEGADIIFDLNKDLPENLAEKYDYIINGGTLEHIFDVAKAMSNISAMVKPGGTIIHIVPFAGLANHGFYSFSPTFFQDYSVANGFRITSLNIEFLLDNGDIVFSQDCRIFDGGDCKINEYVKKIMQINEVECVLLLCIAKKCANKNNYYPIQGLYRKIYSTCSEKRILCYQEIFDLFKASTDKKIALYGSGNIANLLINKLYQNDMEDMVEYIIESDILKAGTQFRGYKVIYPTKLKMDKVDVILICTTKYEDDIYDFLIRMGIKKEKVYRITSYME